MAEVAEQNVTPTASDKPARKPRKQAIGVVASAHKSPGTIRVEVNYKVRHPRYNKYIRRTIVAHAHDPKQEASEGDRVVVMECRPISKNKRWRLVKVIERAPQNL